MSQGAPDWRSSILRKEAYSHLGGVEWIRRPGHSRARLNSQWLTTGLALAVAGVLIAFLCMYRHQQYTRQAASFHQLEGQCTVGTTTCVIRAYLRESGASFVLLKNERVKVMGLYEGEAGALATVIAVEGPNAYLLRFSKPASLPPPVTASVEMIVDRSIASWISPDFTRGILSAHREGM